MLKKIIIFAFFLASFALSFSVRAATCPMDNGAGVGCNAGNNEYYCGNACRQLSAGTTPTLSHCQNNFQVCAPGVDCSNSYAAAYPCGVPQACNSGYTLCNIAGNGASSFPDSKCKLNSTIPVGCSSYNQCTSICSACSAGYELLAGNCVGATVKLGTDSVMSDRLINSTNPLMSILASGYIGIGTTIPHDIFSIGNSGSAPAGSSNTGHNYTSTYLSTDDYALTNYGIVKTLIASATSSNLLWSGTVGGNVWNLNSGNIGIGTTNPLYKLDVVSIGNGSGNLKLQSNADSDIHIWGDGEVGTTSNGKTMYWHRKDADGDNYVSLNINQYDDSIFQATKQWYLNAGTGYGVGIQISGGDTFFGSGWMGDKNPNVKQFGYVPSVLADKYINWQISRATSNFELSRQDSGISYFDIKMPTIITGGNVGIGTTAPNDTFSVANAGVAAPAGSSNTGHNYTSTYLSTDNYALANYGIVKSLIASATSSMGTLWGGTVGANIWNLNSGNVGIGITNPGNPLVVYKPSSATTLQIGQDYGDKTSLDFGTSADSNGYIFIDSVKSASNSIWGDTIFSRFGGNVGIGVTNPIGKLDISSSATTSAIHITSASYNDPIPALAITAVPEEITSNYVSSQNRGFLRLSAGGGVSVAYKSAIDIQGYGVTSTPQIRFYTAGSEWMRIINTGNVGIGTTNPLTKLQVVGDISITGGSALYSYGTGDSGTADARWGNFYNTGAATRFLTSGKGTYSASIPDMYFSKYNGSTVTNMMFIQSSTGNVGIGTTAPNDTFSIGNASVAAPAGSAATGHNYTSTYLNSDDYALTNYGVVKTLIASATSSFSNLWGGTVGGNVWNLNSGNLGIGTTNPTYKLDVQGTSATDGISSDIGFNINPVPNPTAGGVALITSAGNVNAGLHYYWISYVTAIGETNAYQMGSVTTDASHGQVTVTIPVSTDYRVTGRKIHRTQAGGSSWSTYVLTTVNNNTATTYVDNIADASLTGVVSAGFYQLNTTSKQITIGGSTAMVLDTLGTSFGVGAGLNINGGGNNSLFGYNAGKYITSGTQNTYIGTESGQYTTTGTSNVAIGQNSLTNLTSGGYNVAIGRNAITYSTTGFFNVAIGYGALLGASGQNPNYNVAIGTNSGSKILTGGNYNVFLGYQAGNDALQKTDAVNSMALGYNAYTTASNQFIYGNASVTQHIFQSGNVGIGTTAPNDTFSIGNSGAAPAGSSATGHNYTSTYLSTDNYALVNYGIVKTLISNAASTMSQPVFATSTAATYNGLQAGSYTGANALCAAVLTGSHVCTTAEIFNTINGGLTATIPLNSTLWINNGPPGYTANVNDCMGWTSSSASNGGAVWIKVASGDGFGSLQTCDISRKYACCK